MTEMRDDPIAVLLSEGLDLCVRARKLDAQAAAVEMQKLGRIYETVCATPWLWVQDQYERDLADWEARARKALAP